MYRWDGRGGVHTHVCTGGVGGAEYIHMHVQVGWEGRSTYTCMYCGMGGAEYIHMHVQVGWEERSTYTCMVPVTDADQLRTHVTIETRAWE
jgi:predicted DNA-binding protein with PD1-like motif